MRVSQNPSRNIPRMVITALLAVLKSQAQALLAFIWMLYPEQIL